MSRPVDFTIYGNVVEEGDPPVVIAFGPRGPKGDPGVSGDATFSQPFSSASSVTVTHNLGKYPSVTVRDSAGDECEGAVHYINANQLTVSFSAAFSGIVVCN